MSKKKHHETETEVEPPPEFMPGFETLETAPTPDERIDVMERFVEPSPEVWPDVPKGSVAWDGEPDASPEGFNMGKLEKNRDEKQARARRDREASAAEPAVKAEFTANAEWKDAAHPVIAGSLPTITCPKCGTAVPS